MRTSSANQLAASVSHGKATYPALFGMEKAKEAAQAAAANALAAVAGLGEEAWPLRELIDYILHRDR